MSDMVEFAQNVNGLFHYLRNPSLILDWLATISYWIASIGSVLCLIYHAVTGCPKPSRIMLYLIVTYVLLKGMSMI